MGERNASASALGWDFQANAAILLMLENIKEAEKIRIEGADEDIEITLIDETKIYSQVKCVAKPNDYTNVIEKLTGALETLNLDAKNNDGSLFTYITNSPNPFNNQKTMSYFSSRTHLYYDELPEQAQNKINELISKNGYGNLDTNVMDIRVIPFHGRDSKNRYKWIQESINELLVELEMPTEGISSKILEIWQRDFFQNATQPDTDIAISKSKMIWPLIVLIIDRAVANDYKKDFDDDEISVIERKYRSLINYNTMLYEFVTKVVTDHRKSKRTAKDFVDESWKTYISVIENVDADELEKETLMKIILYKILVQKKYISDVKKGVNL